ncbi:MAG: hypothetical protein GX660_12195 [Clostridiaceae bacterium]|nr:hypothetical protein [Clostridiaceae bacterium]
MFNFRQQLSFVIAIPIINVIADTTQNYFVPGFASPGYVRALLILIFIFICFKGYYRNNSINNLIMISLVYYFIISLFSSDLFYTQSIFLKYFIASMMFPIGYFYINTSDRFKLFLKAMVWVLGIYVISLLISNIFKLGTSDYLGGTIFFGAGRVNITKGMVLILMMFPLLFKNEPAGNKRTILFSIFLCGMIFVFLGVKRSALLGLILGYITYAYLTPYRTKFIKSLVGIIALIYLLSPLYFDVLTKRFTARQEEGRFDISQAKEEEARLNELETVLNAFVEGNISYKLFGAELFNGKSYFKTTRILHTDYATMFSGSGLIGFSFFMAIYAMMIFKVIYFYKKINDPEIKNMLSVSVSLIFALLIMGIAGVVHEISHRAIVFMFCGASISVAKNHISHVLKSTI